MKLLIFPECLQHSAGLFLDLFVAFPIRWVDGTMLFAPFLDLSFVLKLAGCCYSIALLGLWHFFVQAMYSVWACAPLDLVG
jgi:hypothetical protein